MSSSNPSTNPENQMQAWTFPRPCLPSPTNLTLTIVPQPTLESLKPNHLLIKIHYSSIKPLYAHTIMHKFPHFTSAVWIPEMNFSGVIVAIHPDSSNERRLREGDEVFGCQTPLQHIRYGGTAAGFVVLPVDCVARIPRGWGLKEAACLGANSCTALKVLDEVKLKKDHGVVVTGASGSLGSMVVGVLKKVVGEEGFVVGVCSRENVERVRTLGADEIVDYTSTDVLEELSKMGSKKPFDAVIDIAGADRSLLDNCADYLHEQGSYLCVGMTGSTHDESNGMLGVLGSLLWLKIKLALPVMLGGITKKAMFVQGTTNGKVLDRVRQEAENGLFDINVEKVWEMDQLVDAYQVIMRGGRDGRGQHLLHVQD